MEDLCKLHPSSGGLRVEPAPDLVAASGPAGITRLNQLAYWVKITPVLLYPKIGANRLSSPPGPWFRMLSYNKLNLDREARNHESLVVYGLPKGRGDR